MFQRPDPRVAQQVRRQVMQLPTAQYLPMGKISRIGRLAMSPDSIKAGARAFEQEVRQYQLAQKQMVAQELMKRRALAAKQQAQAAFKKVWPEGSSEKLLGNFINKRPIFNPWK